MALIRYPGSKEKLSAQIRAAFPDAMRLELWANAMRWEYREPFFGAGAVGFKVLKVLHPNTSVWINDIDPGIVALWRTVQSRPIDLCKLIGQFSPSADLFYKFKEQDGDESMGEIRLGFQKLALHQMSVSGFGFKSGGPLGGRNQDNARYPVNCRWNPERLQLHVSRLHRRMKAFDSLKITCQDFATLLDDVPSQSFVYLDPPYFDKGPQLYKYPMTQFDHARLADAVRALKCYWALSYDDKPEIRQMYSGFRVHEMHITYTNATHQRGQRPKNREILILPGAEHVQQIA